MPSTFVLLYSVFNVLDGGDNRNRTDGLLLARQALSQLSYTPMWRVTIRFNRSSFKETGGLKWTRTIDLALIRRAL